MTTTQWTIFWKNLGIKTIKRPKAEKNYKANKDFRALQSLGVNRMVAQDIYDISLQYGDPLFFSSLSRFFRLDAETIKLWIKGKSISNAFQRLFDLIDPGDLKASYDRLEPLDLIFKFHSKGVGRQYEADYKGTSTLDFHPKSLIFNLNRIGKGDFKYKKLGFAKLGKDLIVSIEKTSQTGLPVYKFIKLSRQGKKLKVILSMDSGKEYNAAKRALEKWFKVYIDTPQTSKSLDKLNDFLLKGESNNFILSGVTYFDGEFKLSVSDIYGRPLNTGSYPAYKRKIAKANKRAEIIYQIRILSKKKFLAKPIAIAFLSYKTAGIIGAITLSPNDRKLNSRKRKQLNDSFAEDFGIPLNEFITYNDLDEIGIYKIFLEGTPQRVENIDLRSKLAMSIYQQLLTDNLLSFSHTVEEQTRFCVNRNCENRYIVLWERKTCEHCGQVLINGKKLVTQEIDEGKIVDYLEGVYNQGIVTKLLNKLLRRPLYVAKIKIGDNEAEYIPLSGQLKDYQLEILKFRYPNLVVITGKDNVEDFENAGIKALPLYEVIYDCKKNNSSLITKHLDEAVVEHLDNVRRLCKVAVKRIADNDFYRDKNSISKYFGAELFEADCSAMLNYVFGNSLWLGAKYRGKNVPDGFTAFPLHDKQNGCFIWDAKFGEGKTLHMGNFPKNHAYISAAKRNQSIKDNGGLRGFVFISNQKFPVKFTKKYLPLTKGSRLKVTFLSAVQLQMITEQFRRYEKLIYNNGTAKTLFLESMKDIFFNTRYKRKCEIIDDNYLRTLLAANSKSLKRLKAGKLLAV